MVQQITLSSPVLPSQTALRIEQARSLRQDTAAKQRQMQLQESKLQQQSYLNDLRRRAATDPQALNELAAFNPQEAIGIQDYRNNVTQRLARSALAIKTVPLPDRAETYQRQIKILKSEGYPVDTLPAEYDPDIVNPQLDEIITMSRDVEKSIEALEGPEPTKREIIETQQGFVAVDPTTGLGMQVRTQGGDILRSKEKVVEPKTEIAKLRSDLENGFISQKEFRDASAAIRKTVDKPLSSEAAKTLTIANTGLDSIKKIREFTKRDDFRQVALGSASLYPRIAMGSKQRQYEAVSRNLADVLGRLRSGGAINEEELKTFKSLLPNAYDDPETREFKLKQLEDQFILIYKSVGGAQTNKAQGISGQVNGISWRVK